MGAARRGMGVTKKQWNKSRAGDKAAGWEGARVDWVIKRGVGAVGLCLFGLKRTTPLASAKTQTTRAAPNHIQDHPLHAPV